MAVQADVVVRRLEELAEVPDLVEQTKDIRPATPVGMAARNSVSRRKDTANKAERTAFQVTGAAFLRGGILLLGDMLEILAQIETRIRPTEAMPRRTLRLLNVVDKDRRLATLSHHRRPRLRLQAISQTRMPRPLPNTRSNSQRGHPRLPLHRLQDMYQITLTLDQTLTRSSLLLEVC